MAFVNTAQTRKWNASSDSASNCALCTAAGAINLTHGRSVVTTGNLAQKLGAEDNKYGLGKDHNAQAASIKKIVADSTSRKPEQIGTQIEEVKYSETLKWMEGFADKTVFAVCITGFAGGVQSKCHWLNALKAGSTIRYFDFQTSRDFEIDYAPPGGANPASSTGPFIGVLTQMSGLMSNKAMHGAHPSASFDTSSATCVAIAFPP